MAQEHKKLKDGVGHSAVASQPCPSDHITADKRLRCYAPSPKLPSVTSFIRKTLGEIYSGHLNSFYTHKSNIS